MKRRKVAKLRELSPDDNSGPSASLQETILVSRFRELDDKCIGRRTRAVNVPDTPHETPPKQGDQERQEDNFEPDVDDGMDVDGGGAQVSGTDVEHAQEMRTKGDRWCKC